LLISFTENKKLSKAIASARHKIHQWHL